MDVCTATDYHLYTDKLLYVPYSPRTLAFASVCATIFQATSRDAIKNAELNWTIDKSSVGQDGQGRERRAVLHDSSDHPGKYVCSRSRHPRLNVTMQVENRLFRVPRQSLESQSKIFRDMFSLPVAEDTEGSSDNNPIRLDGIKKEEFKRFLEVLFMG